MKLKFAIFSLAIAQLAGAATVFDNGAPNLQNAAASDLGNGFTSYENFILGGTTTLRSVQWWGIYFPGNTASADSFTVSIYANNAGQPGSAVAGPLSVAATRQVTSNTVGGTWDLYLYDAVIPDTVLGAGTYWLSIVNNTSGADSWYWATSASSGDARQNTGALNLELAFNLSDTASTVPEPSTYLLSAAGLAGIFLAARRRPA